MKKRKISPEETKGRLLKAGLHLFGIKGFEATRTRELADLAEVNQAAIPYHFGGKEGLYLAVAEYVVKRGREDMHDKMTAVMLLVQSGNLTKEFAGRALIGILHAFVERVVMAEDIGDRARFIMREYTTPGAGFDIIYNGFLERMHTLLCALVGVILDEDPEEESIIIRTHSLFGTALSMVAAKALLLRRLGWDDYSQERVEDIKRIITETVTQSLQLGDTGKSMEAS